jgi:hypothetical protein
MVFKDGKPSAFYQEYVKNIQVKIVENAALEFACIWNEYSRPGSTKTRTAISDELSGKLNAMQAQLESSDLFDDGGSRRVVLKKAIPQVLVKQVGLDALMKRLPEPYQRALVSSWIAAHFVRVFFCQFSVFADAFYRSINTELQGQALTFSISFESLMEAVESDSSGGIHSLAIVWTVHL